MAPSGGRWRRLARTQTRRNPSGISRVEDAARRRSAADPRTSGLAGGSTTICSVRRSWRLPVALVTAVVVAEAAVLVMRPRDRGPEPLPVEPRAYFSQAQIEKAEEFRTGQLWIYVAQTAIGLGVLVLFVRRPPERLAEIGRAH